MTSIHFLLCTAAVLSPLSRAADGLPVPGTREPAAVGHSAAAPPVQAIGAYVTTVLVPSLSDTAARAVLVRQPQGTGTLNLIFVTPQTTPRDLLRALAALNRVRRVRGEVVTQEMRASILPAAGPGAERGSSHAEAEQELARLRASAPHELPGIGRYRALTYSLPALR